MATERKIPDLFNYAMFCGGCGHGVLVRLICECLEELGQIGRASCRERVFILV